MGYIIKCPICNGDYNGKHACGDDQDDLIAAVIEARQWARHFKRLADDYHGAQIMIANERNRTANKNAELRRQLDTLVKIQDFITIEMDEYSDGQLDDLEIVKDVYYRLHRALLEIETLHQSDEVMTDQHNQEIQFQRNFIDKLRRQLELAADALSDIRHGAIALSAEESEKLYRKIAAETLAKLDSDGE